MGTAPKSRIFYAKKPYSGKTNANESGENDNRVLSKKRYYSNMESEVIMGTKKGQVRKTARRAYEPKKIWIPFGRVKPRKDDEMFFYRGVLSHIYKT